MRVCDVCKEPAIFSVTGIVKAKIAQMATAEDVRVDLCAKHMLDGETVMKAIVLEALNNPQTHLMNQYP